MLTQTTQVSLERLLPVLVHIQTHLDGDLSLESLAQLVNLSPHHFHRLFRGLIGETVKQYTQRLRLERAAFELKIRHASVIDIAFGVGYHSHETFTRAFKKHFGVTPQAYKQSHGFTKQKLQKASDGQVDVAQSNGHQPLNNAAMTYSISKPSIQTFESIQVAFIRHLGPYAEADLQAFESLMVWTKAHHLYNGHNLLLAIGHDDPNITPSDKVRFDACIQVPHAVDPQLLPRADPLEERSDSIGYQVIPSGTYAVTTYIGPLGNVLEQAYAAIFQQFHALKGYEIIGLPVVEIYRTTTINPEYALTHTEICVPVMKRM